MKINKKEAENNQILKTIHFIKLFYLGQSRPLFSYFPPFLITISTIQIEKIIGRVLGIQTHGRRMVGGDQTTDLLRPPINTFRNILFEQLSGQECLHENVSVDNLIKRFTIVIYVLRVVM